MTHDAAIPPGLEPATSAIELRGIYYTAARWTPEDLGSLANHLAGAGSAALTSLSDEDLLETWNRTIDAFLDPGSVERRELDPALTRLCRLSLEGLTAGLQAVLGGVSAPAASELQRQIWRLPDRRTPTAPVLVILASNLPGLAVQPLLPALLLRRPVIVKSPSSEPLFAPALVRALRTRLPRLESALAAITWQGGDPSLEAPLLRAAERILAYGDTEALEDLQARAVGELVPYGPKTSLAIVSGSVDPVSQAPGLARDIALFDQRGCLSVQAIFTDGEAPALADRLAEELCSLERLWPAGPLDPVAIAGVQQIRSEATLRGLHQPVSSLSAGTVVVEPESRFLPGPGLRTVRIHPVSDLQTLPETLREWAGQLQGAALAGDAAWRLRPQLEELGLSRFAAPGDLQKPDALWHNGGVHPFTALTGQRLEETRSSD